MENEFFAFTSYSSDFQLHLFSLLQGTERVCIDRKTTSTCHSV